jgi:glucosamine-phosphate N-acetyltransferase
MDQPQEQQKQQEVKDNVQDHHSGLPESVTIQTSLVIRKLGKQDFNKNFIPLLEQLSTVGSVTEQFFHDHLTNVYEHESSQIMLVAEDVSLNRICATGSLVIEPKFIHSAGYAGHLEDLVVDSGLRGKGVGKKIVEQLKHFAKTHGCYKVILDCSEANVPFYEKCGFKRKECSMVSYFAENELKGFILGPDHVKLSILPQEVNGLVIRQLSEEDYHR